MAVNKGAMFPNVALGKCFDQLALNCRDIYRIVKFFKSSAKNLIQAGVKEAQNGRSAEGRRDRSEGCA
jgi:hypothetical protein